jgi:hypothetical protein
MSTPRRAYIPRPRASPGLTPTKAAPLPTTGTRPAPRITPSPGPPPSVPTGSWSTRRTPTLPTRPSTRTPIPARQAAGTARPPTPPPVHSPQPAAAPRPATPDRTHGTSSTVSFIPISAAPPTTTPGRMAGTMWHLERPICQEYMSRPTAGGGKLAAHRRSALRFMASQRRVHR